MSTPKSQPNYMPALVGAVIAAFTLIVAGGAFVAYSLSQQAKQTNEIGSALVRLATKIDAQPAAPTGPEFQKAVVSAIEQIAESKRQEIAKAKQAKYINAPEQGPEGKHIYGSPNARFTLVEFSDFECPYCKRFHETPKRLADQSNGNVNWQWKHMPLSFHNPAAHSLAVASECVAELGGNRKFWIFAEDVFLHTRGNGQGLQGVSTFAADAGVDETKFNECMSSGRHQATVESDINQATKLGVTGTPATFLVDNSTGKSVMLGGAQPPEAFVAAMRKMMAESNSADDSGAKAAAQG